MVYRVAGSLQQYSKLGCAAFIKSSAYSAAQEKIDNMLQSKQCIRVAVLGPVTTAAQRCLAETWVDDPGKAPQRNVW